MSDNLPDITQSSAWQALAEHHRELTPDLRGWFAEDPERAEKLTVTAGDRELEASLADLGVSVDATATAQAAVDRDDSLTGVLSSTWSGEHVVEPVVTVDVDRNRIPSRWIHPLVTSRVLEAPAAEMV